MSKRIYVDDLKAKFEAAGVEWRDEYADELMSVNRQALVDNHGSGKTLPVLTAGGKPEPTQDEIDEFKGTGDRLKAMSETPGASEMSFFTGVEPKKYAHGYTTGSRGTIPDDGRASTRLLRAIGKAGAAIPLNPIDYNSVIEPAESKGTKLTDFGGSVAGMMYGINKLKPATAPIAKKIGGTVGKTTSPLLDKMIGRGIDEAIAFGGYNALMPAENPMDWAQNTAQGLVLGGTLGAGGAAVGALGKAGPEIVEDLSGYLWDTSVITALEMHGGESFEDALAKGLTFALGRSIAGGAGGRSSEPLDASRVEPTTLVEIQKMVGGRFAEQPKLLDGFTESYKRIGTADTGAPQIPRAATRPGTEPHRPAREPLQPRIIRPKEPALLNEAVGQNFTMNDPAPSKYTNFGEPLQGEVWPKESGGKPAGKIKGGMPEVEPSPYDQYGYPRPLKRGGTTLDAMGTQQIYDRIVERFKRPKTRTNESTVKDLAEGATDPIRGVGVSKFTSEYRKGKIKTFGELTEAIANNPNEVQGVSTPEKLTAARDILIQERAANGDATAPTDAQVEARWRELEFPDIVADIKAGKILDKSPNWAQTADRALVLKGMGGGEPANALERHTLRVLEEGEATARLATEQSGTEVMEIARKHGLSESNPDAEVMGQVQAHWDYKGGETIDAFAAGGMGQNILSQAKNPQAIIEFMREVRDGVEGARVTMDAMSKNFGGKGVAVQDTKGEPGYLKRIDQRGNIIQRVKSAATDNVDADSYTSISGGGPDRTFNPTARRRTKGNDNRDWNWFRAMNEFYKDHGNQAKTISTNHLETVADLLRDHGLNRAADSITAINQRYNNNIAFGVEKHLNAAMDSNIATKALQGTMLLNKKRFDNTRYRGNPGMWEAQTRSLHVLNSKDPISFNLAIKDLANPSIWKMNNNTTVSTIKRSRVGQRRAEAGAEVGNVDTLLEQGKVDKAKEVVLDWMTNHVEQVTTQIGLNFERHNMGEAKWNKLTAREKMDAISDGTKLTQQQYDVTGTAPIMNTRLIKGTLPAMRYRIDSHLGQLRQIWDKAIGEAFEGGNTKKVWDTAKFLTGATMADLTGMALKGYGSGGVIASILLWSTISGDETGLVGQAKSKVYRAVNKFKKGDFEGGLTIFINEILPARWFTNLYESVLAHQRGEIENPLEVGYGTVFGKNATAESRNENYGQMFSDPMGLIPEGFNPNASDELNVPKKLFYGDDRKRTRRKP